MFHLKICFSPSVCLSVHLNITLHLSGFTPWKQTFLCVCFLSCVLRSAVSSTLVVGLFTVACRHSLTLFFPHARWSCVDFKTEMHFIMVTWLMVLINQGPSTIAALLWKTNCPPRNPPDGSPQLLLMEVTFTDSQLPTCRQGNTYACKHKVAIPVVQCI